MGGGDYIDMINGLLRVIGIPVSMVASCSPISLIRHALASPYSKNFFAMRPGSLAEAFGAGALPYIYER